MTIQERAAIALDRARAAGTPEPAADTAHLRRLRAAMTRDVAAMLGILPEHIVVTDDPLRGYGDIPGQLITVQDPDAPTAALRFIPEPGNTGCGGGTYLLLAACPGCSGPDDARDVPTCSVAGLADLARRPTSAQRADRPPDLHGVPVEFFDDPAHAPDCPLR